MIKNNRIIIDNKEKNRSIIFEIYIEMMNVESEDFMILDDSEFEGFFNSEFSETMNNNQFIINDSLITFLKNNRLLQQILLNHISRK